MVRIDLRSDTVTQPTAAMRDAIFRAEVGDDVFGEDPTINALEHRMALMFGHASALFCPSGTQTNQVALATWMRPGDEVICSKLSHIYLYEGGGVGANAGASMRLIGNDFGMFTADEVVDHINNPNDVHLPLTRLVSVEDTVNKGGGAVWNPTSLREIRKVCTERGLLLHCDGARAFNALTVTRMDTADYGRLFDSLSICLSKGLGAPAGSVLIGDADFISRARRVRKRFGGGMRQAGFLAAAGMHALDHHVSRLDEDHQKALHIAEVLRTCRFTADIMPVQTNIVIFAVRTPYTGSWLRDELSKNGVDCFPFGTDKIRFVFHLDITEVMMEQLEATLRDIKEITRLQTD